MPRHPRFGPDIPILEPDMTELLRMPSVMEATNLSRSTIYRMIKTNRFPAPVKLSSRIAVWPATELAEWQRAAMAAPRPAMANQ
jgi:prophage regulatory protein